MIGATVVDFELKGCDDPDRFEAVELEKDGKRFWLESYFSRIDEGGDGMGIHAHGGTEPRKDGDDDGREPIADGVEWVDATYEEYWDWAYAKDPAECLMALKEMIECHKIGTKRIEDRIKRLYPAPDMLNMAFAIYKTNEVVRQREGQAI